MGVSLPRERGFGTEQLRAAARAGAARRLAPRGCCAAGMPSLYHDDDFTMRFLGAVETVLDPLLAMLDALPAHFDVRLAPDDVLDLLAAWLGPRARRDAAGGAPAADRPPGLRARAPAGNPGRASSWRCTSRSRACRSRSRTAGRAAGALREEDLPPPGPCELVVRCRVPMPTETAAAVARTIEEVKPAHVPYKLRVRTAREGA